MTDSDNTYDGLLDEVRALRRELARRHDSDPDSETRYRSVVDNVVDGIITIDENGLIESFNPAAARIFGYEPKEVLGRNVSMLMPAPYKEEHDGYIERYKSTRKPRIIGIGRQVTGRRKDGSEFPMELSVGEFTDEGVRRFTGVVRDITERKHLEEQLLQAQKMESVGQLAGGVAHDFNNQLGIILFDVDMLLAAVDDAPVRDDLQRIRKTVLRAADLTRQLLVFSRRQRMEPQALDLNEHLRDLCKMMTRLLGEDVQPELELAETSCIIEADPGNLDQVLINLCLNARDAMPRGGALLVSTESVTVGEQECRIMGKGTPGRYVRLTVSDSGTGMAEDVRRRVFEPFFTTKETGKGTGLGLAVVYGIVEGHGGWITVESEPGTGSRFQIYLPRVGGAVEDVDHPEEPDTEKGDGERILLLEDDDDLRGRLVAILTQARYAVTPCSDLAAAQREYAPGTFDLLLSDVILPDGRGSDFCFEVQAQEPSLPIIILTGHTDGQVDWDQVQERGIAVLHKPIGMAELLEQVRGRLS